MKEPQQNIFANMILLHLRYFVKLLRVVTKDFTILSKPPSQNYYLMTQYFDGESIDGFGTKLAICQFPFQ